MKIAFLDPVPEQYKLEILVKEISKYKSDNTELIYHNDLKGTDNFEYLTFEAFMIPEIIKKVMTLGEENYDGVIIGCFHDPGLDALKECTSNITITAPAESALSIAAMLGRTYALISPSKKTMPQQLHITEKYRSQRLKLVSHKSLDMKVTELQDNTTDLLENMSHKIEESIIESNPEVIILGCTLEVGQFEILQKKYNRPVIDAGVAALKQAEFLINCKDRCGWKVSKTGTYSSPSSNDFSKLKDLL